MFFENKKGQVDISITIGAIIIPMAAIFSSIIFTWATLSPLTDAGALATTIAHDVAGIAEVAYSVPEDIKIRYSPPKTCSFEKKSGGSGYVISCFYGKMNLTRFYITEESFSTLSPMGIINAPMRINAIAEVVLNPDAFENFIIDSIIPVTYPGFANMRDYDLNQFNTRIFEIKEDYVEVTKEKNDYYNTLSKYSTGLGEDSLKAFMEEIINFCSYSQSLSDGEVASTKISFNLPRDYFILRNDAEESFIMKKKSYSPDFTGDLSILVLEDSIDIEYDGTNNETRVAIDSETYSYPLRLSFLLANETGDVFDFTGPFNIEDDFDKNRYSLYKMPFNLAYGSYTLSYSIYGETQIANAANFHVNDITNVNEALPLEHTIYSFDTSSLPCLIGGYSLKLDGNTYSKIDENRLISMELTSQKISSSGKNILINIEEYPLEGDNLPIAEYIPTEVSNE